MPRKQNTKVSLNPAPRKDWEKSFKKMARNGDDKPLITDIFKDEKIVSGNAKPKRKSQSKKRISKKVKSLKGIIKLAKDYDYKKEYTDYLIKKYK